MTLLTSHPELAADLGPQYGERFTVRPYRTFAELEELMAESVRRDCDALIHCAAVSDYQPAGIYAPAVHTRFRPDDGSWRSTAGDMPALVDRAADKVKSDQPELWLRLSRTPKLVDKVRGELGFAGILVKFKLEAGIPETELEGVAERSRRQSRADLMVANTLEGMQKWALLGPVAGSYQRVARSKLPALLFRQVESLHEERGHG